LRRQGVDPFGADENFPGTRLFEAGDQPQDRRLATSGGAEENAKLPVRNLERDSVQYCRSPEAFGKLFYLKRSDETS
jgi:hypothetical protein